MRFELSILTELHYFCVGIRMIKYYDSDCVKDWKGATIVAVPTLREVPKRTRSPIKPDPTTGKEEGHAQIIKI